MTGIRSDELLTLTADIVAAHVANNEVAVSDLPALISNVHQALGGLGERQQPAAEPRQPAVPIRSSIKADYIVCLEDGKKLKMLKRYLMTRHGLTPAEYRSKWNLPADYPMVAPDYAASRSAIAQRIGLGRAASEAVPEELAPAEAVEPVKAVEPAEPATEAPIQRKVLRPVFKPKAETSQAVGVDATALLPAQDQGETATQPLDVLCKAIERRSCVTATYNKRRVTLAPHVVYTRHEEPFLRAVTVEHEGKRPKELKLGTFKVAGLGALAASTRPLLRYPGFTANDPDYVGDTICVLLSI